MKPWEHLTAGERNLLDRVFWSAGMSRGVLATMADVSKSKANATVTGLVERGLLTETEGKISTGGRRPEILRLNHRLGVLAGIDIGVTSLDVALLAPDMTVLTHHGEPADVRASPTLLFSRVRELLCTLLAQQGLRPDDVLGIGVGVPGPVAFDTSLLVNPPLMPGWEGFSIREFLGEVFAAPVTVDNDVNLMALGTLWRLHRQLENFLVIKIGTGIGCGIVSHGALYRGADGAAGDVGHICVDPQGPLCHCGNVGCVEAMAGAAAIGRMAEETARAGASPVLAELLAQNGVLGPIDVGSASRAGDAAASAIIQQSGMQIGRMLAALVNFFNPSHVFIGGGIAQIGPLMLSSIRQSVYQRSLALSTRHLDIRYVPHAENAGVIGAGVLAMEETVLSARRQRHPGPILQRGDFRPGSARALLQQ